MEPITSTLLSPYAIAGGLVIVLIIAFRSRGRSTPRARDPQRMFTAAQRAQVFSNAGGRCEMSTVFGRRCTRNAHHADHFLPWSRGGASSFQNLVAACSFHNLAKGARMPSTFAKGRIESRRSKYWPAGVPRSAGEWWSR